MDEIKKDTEVVEEVKAEEVKTEEVRYTEVENKGGNPLSITALVLGIVSVVFDFIFVWVGLVAGIVGIVLGVKARKKEDAKGMATAGFVVSIIGVAIGGALLICAICLVGSYLGAGGGLTDFM